MGIHKYGPDTSSSQLGIKSLGTRIPRTRWGTILDHAFMVHFDELICVMYA